ncbi:MAG: glycerate kinase [Proteobacteria bacterium]|nr:glycerate kinase [Pseudomonadota bacterium]
MKTEDKKLQKMRTDAIAIFAKGIEAVEPFSTVKNACRTEAGRLVICGKSFNLSRFNRIYMIGFGKATAPMASAMEDLLKEHLTAGIIIVKYGHGIHMNRTRIIEAGHPIPDEKGVSGTTDILELARQAGKNDLVICLVSGGGSSLLVHPAAGITLEDKQEISRILIECGATIQEINTIRKHLSAVKGGQLASLVYPATLVTLMMSDVVGDDPGIIASGPTVPDKSTFKDCLDVMGKYNLGNRLPSRVKTHLENGLNGLVNETPASNHEAFKTSWHWVIGNNMTAILSAQKEAERLTYNTVILSSMIEGENRHVAAVHTAIVREIMKTGHPINVPACILSGGETTVTVTGKGKGGRNQEFALACVKNIHDLGQVVILSTGTDGTDGPTDAAGAIVDSHTFSRSRSLCLDPEAYLRNSDSYEFFKKLDDLFITGPTHTNVMDLRILLVDV